MTDKRLIEDDLPIETISAEARREKSVRQSMSRLAPPFYGLRRALGKGET